MRFVVKDSGMNGCFFTLSDIGRVGNKDDGSGRRKVFNRRQNVVGTLFGQKVRLKERNVSTKRRGVSLRH